MEVPRQRLRVGIRIPPSRPLPEIAALAKVAEDAGFDTVAIPDSPALMRDTIACLCLAAIETSTVTLATGVTNLVTRSPMLLASAIRTVADLAPGRLRIGIGAGDSAVNLTGQKPASTEALREGVASLSALLLGQEIGPGGSMVLNDPPGPIPVYLAANRPRNIALAAEVADGLITNPRGISQAFRIVDTIVTQQHRDRAFQRATSILTCVTEDVEREARRMKPKIANHLRRDGQAMLEESGYTVEIPSGHIPLPDGSDLGHPRDWDAAVEIASQWISDDLALWYVDRFMLFGTGEEIYRRLVHLAYLGVDEVICEHPYSLELPSELIADLGTVVIPRLRDPAPSSLRDSHLTEGTAAAPKTA